MLALEHIVQPRCYHIDQLRYVEQGPQQIVPTVLQGHDQIDFFPAPHLSSNRSSAPETPPPDGELPVGETITPTDSCKSFWGRVLQK